MKYSLKLIILLFIFISVSCQDKKEPLGLCEDIYRPLIVNINYTDSNGKELLFGDQAKYLVDQIKIYKIIMNDIAVPLTFNINKDAKFLTINLDKVESGVFYIKLNSNVLDKISYTSKIDEKSPCKDYKLIDIKQNDLSGRYDEKNQVWILKK
ncbi:hypothetical protein [Sphingobacterium athyrii]|uniref:Lipoprotein n=1 Tax=Sphingobacterium athyrii TaxID=2152717 RepID=A0A363P0H2_9SPHI|nr:hypothetical protein [Sphingobacterium athyrii]PUV26373.1 hypothetical protein DCO56_05345 [Sphingobacterium athyrii]